MKKPEWDRTPFTVIIDTREQHPYHFDGFASNRKVDGVNVPLIVPTETATLKSGDYSIRGCEDLIAVERKSIPDLFSTLTHGRDRFVRELERLQEMQFACVAVEGDWDAVLNYRETQVNPKTIYHSVLAFQQRYKNVHWWMCPSRNFAERTALRVLERFWKERNG